MFDDLKCSKPVIDITVGYDWGDGNGLKCKSWKMIRETLKHITDEVKILAVKHKGEHPLIIRIRRLRARHGATVMGSILGRIREADILLLDISGEKANVMFELGCAIGSRKDDDVGKVYVLWEGKEPPIFASDLNGVMFTLYKTPAPSNKPDKISQKPAKISDLLGFRAALRSSIIAIARERGMWRDKLLRSKSRKPMLPDSHCKQDPADLSSTGLKISSCS